VLLTLVRLFLFDVMRVEGHSMEPTFRPKQIVFINRAYYGLLIPFTSRYLIMWRVPKRGDIVVFRLPEGRKTFIKRCVGVAGDRMAYESGYLYVGDSREPIPVHPTSRILRKNKVPGGSLLALGDNHDNSVDSRYLGFIPLHTILGRVIHPDRGIDR
jgi:signal peptidase I